MAESVVDSRRLRLRQMVKERGFVGITPWTAAKEFERMKISIARETIYRWLTADTEAGLMTVYCLSTPGVRFRWATGTEG